jgi:ribosomal protein S18 acetylase RimI-like enzyme
MEIRSITAKDLPALSEIDATVHSTEYLHVDRSGEGLSAQWKIEPRPLRERRSVRRDLTDEQQFDIKQIVTGIEEGISLLAEHEGQIVAAAVAKRDDAAGILRLIDIRVDFDFRRQGLGSAMMFQIIQFAREHEMRAIAAQTQADNFSVLQLLAKLGFEPTGLDTHLLSNHDLVKETVALFWYLTLN